MSESQFKDFDLVFERVGDLYRPRVVHSAVGEVTGAAFSAPAWIGQEAKSEQYTPEEIGQNLFETTFSGEIRQALNETLEALGSRRRDLRIRLRLNRVPELGKLPWEFLYSPEKKEFLSLENPFVRVVGRPGLARKEGVILPLRVLVVGSQEAEDLERTLAVPLRKGQIVLDHLDRPDPAALREKIHTGKFQVIHLGGRSSDPATRMSLAVPGVLQGSPARIAVVSSAQPLTVTGQSTAEGLLRRGITTVVETPLRRDSANRFHSVFYDRLAKGEPVEAAVAEARRSLRTVTGASMEWGAPVLYSGITRGESFRVNPQVGSPVSTSIIIGAATGEKGGPPSPDEPPTDGSPRDHEPKPRFLQGRFQPRVHLGDTVALQVRIALSAGKDAAPLRPLEVPPEGLEALLVLYAPGFEILQSNQRMVRVPFAADSDWVAFEMKAVRVGVHSVDVTAYAGGAMLGSLTLEVTIDEALPTSESQELQQPFWPRLAPDEVSLSIRYDDFDKVYRFMLIDGTGRPPQEVAQRLQQTPVEAVESLVKKLNAVAQGDSKYTAEQTRRWLKGEGIALWESFIPQDLRRQFWELQSRIQRIAIVSDEQGDPVPWELLYPFTPGPGGDVGFFAERFQVSRWIASRGGFAPPHLRLRHAAFVEPPTSKPLPRAAQEIEAIRLLTQGRGARNGDIIKDFTSLMDLFTAGDFNLLHFACHNSYQTAKITMGGTPFEPVFLREFAGRFQKAEPLVFLNACRSDIQSQSYTGLEGWARAFLRAGAAAFIGTLWVVRDETAAQFAEVFYDALLGTQPRSLGHALRTAREAIRDVPGDPTWLAYTLYGNTAATLI